MHRAVILTADQWNIVKALFLQYVPQFSFRTTACCLSLFHSMTMSTQSWTNCTRKSKNCDTMWSGPLPHMLMRQRCLPPPPAALPARDVRNHPRPPHSQEERPQKKRRHVDGRPTAIHMDGDMQVDEKQEAKEERDMQWELAQWFSLAAPFLTWYAVQSQPDVQWKALEPEFPRLREGGGNERLREGVIVPCSPSSPDSVPSCPVMFLL